MTWIGVAKEWTLLKGWGATERKNGFQGSEITEHFRGMIDGERVQIHYFFMSVFFLVEFRAF